jgi:hypothetical protein
MARQVVATARQRYKMIPKLDGSGNPVVTPVMKKDGVTPRTTRAGKPVVRKVTIADKSQPIDTKCERCGKLIKPGSKYRKVAIKQTYGGIRRRRCIECPAWEPWELSNSLASRIMQIQGETVDGSEWNEEQEARDRAGEIAEMIRELASEKEEAASNMEEGFGHPTSQSEEISEQAQSLNDWADEVENAVDNADDFPEEGQCANCGGEGQLECSDHERHSDDEGDEDYCDGNEECVECGGTGEGEDIDEQLIEDWRQSAQQAIEDALSNCPI